MLSSARIYIFNLQYKNNKWIDNLNANELAGLIANVMKVSLSDLEYKNLQIFNVFKNNLYSSEMHINKIKFKKRKILLKEDIAELRKKLAGCLNSISTLKFEQIHVVNDEFSKQPTDGYLRG
jgi:hypothetical protein